MSIMEAIRSSITRESSHDEHQISPESSSAEWMKFMRDLRNRTIQADIALENDKSDKAVEAYLYEIGMIDFEAGRSAEITVDYLNEHGPRAYDKRGKARDGSSDIKAPLEIRVLEDALVIFEHTRTENAQALVEALLIKYSDEQQWTTVGTIRERYVALSGQKVLKEI